MPVRFSNNAFATLASSLTNVATTISLTAGQGARFPSLDTGDYFYATILDSSNNLEIVKVTARSTDTLTVTRGQDGTSARSFSAGDRIELRIVSAALNALQDYTPSGTISATTVATAVAELDSEKAPKASPAFTGTPTAPTASPGTNSTQLATTAFVTAADVAERSATTTLTNKTISADSNTLSGLAASSFVVSNASGNIDGSADQKAIPTGVVVGTTDTQTLTNKTVNLASNTLTGTKAQFNTAVSDTDFIFANDFTTSLTTNGRQVLPGGFTIIWGEFVSTTDGTQRVSFHTSFDTASVFADLYPGRNDTATLDLDRFGFTVNRADGIGGTPTLKYFAMGY